MPGGSLLYWASALWQARTICLRLLEHLMRLAASRTFWMAGKSRAMSVAMMAITTKSSIRVKASRLHRAKERRMTRPLSGNEAGHRAALDRLRHGYEQGAVRDWMVTVRRAKEDVKKIYERNLRSDRIAEQGAFLSPGARNFSGTGVPPL